MGLISFCFNSDFQSAKRNLRWITRLIIGVSDDEEEEKRLKALAKQTKGREQDQSTEAEAEPVTI